MGETVSKIACAEIQVVNGFYALGGGHPIFLYMMRLKLIEIIILTRKVQMTAL